MRCSHTIFADFCKRAVNYFVIGRVTKSDPNFGDKWILLWELATICQRIRLSKIYLQILLNVSDPERRNYISNKVRFLWSRGFLFLSWYAQPHLVLILLPCSRPFSSAMFLRDAYMTTQPVIIAPSKSWHYHNRWKPAEITTMSTGVSNIPSVTYSESIILDWSETSINLITGSRVKIDSTFEITIRTYFLCKEMRLWIMLLAAAYVVLLNS